jgi:hypothetical protein
MGWEEVADSGISSLLRTALATGHVDAQPPQQLARPENGDKLMKHLKAGMYEYVCVCVC